MSMNICVSVSTQRDSQEWASTKSLLDFCIAVFYVNITLFLCNADIEKGNTLGIDTEWNLLIALCMDIKPSTLYCIN